jgi:hypothetical protein
MQDDGLRRLIYLCYYPKQSIIGRKQRLMRMWTALDKIWWANVVLVGSSNWSSHEVVVLTIREKTV